MQDITPQEARERLARAEGTGIDDDADRRVHGLATTAFGLVIGLYVAVQQRLDEAPWEGVLAGGYVVVLGAVALWQSRASGVVPRRSRRVGRIGLAGTVAAMLTAVVVLNVREASRKLAGAAAAPEPLWVLGLTGLVVALPMLVAGLLIRRGRPA
ncbi:hypothetical protein [Kineosporia sp. R_H_3]|uniref:hypothetical protein n=1 Tax=Kineosporia sp. R_H_3 TaxID=1961848 RepID=UPI000B4B0B0E|nr:hypothetical protein [Kineosporia sp. R_H_3]